MLTLLVTTIATQTTTVITQIALMQVTIMVVIRATIIIITITEEENIRKGDQTIRNSLLIETIIGGNIRIGLMDIKIQAIRQGRITIKRTIITKEILMETGITDQETTITITIHQEEMEE